MGDSVWNKPTNTHYSFIGIDGLSRILERRLHVGEGKGKDFLSSRTVQFSAPVQTGKAWKKAEMSYTHG